MGHQQVEIAKKTGRCHTCNILGHWSSECPEKYGSAPSRKTSSPFLVTTDEEFPTTYCVCGNDQPCHIGLTKKDNKNHNRKFYKCPGFQHENCGYFKWCDELRKKQILVSPVKLKYPTCLCGAGICQLLPEKAGSRFYFGCHIDEGDGACQTKWWHDEYVKDSSSDQSKSPNLNKAVLGHVTHTCEDSLVAVPEKLERHVIDEASPETSRGQISLHDDISGTKTKDISMTEIITCNSATKYAYVFTPKSEIDTGAARLKRQMTTPADCIDDLAIWMPEEPCTESLKRVKHNPSIQPLCKLNRSSLPSRRLNFDEANVVPSVRCNQVTVSSKSELISLLESLSPFDHKKMLDMTDHILSTMKNVDEDFSSRVRKYVACAKSLAEAETSCPSYWSDEELEAIYVALKSSYEESAFNETITASALLLKKEMLSTTEASANEVEIQTLEASSKDISEQTENLKERMRESDELRRQLQEWESNHCNAKTEYEIARQRLRV